MNEKFYSNGLKFSCAGCSHCCRHEPGYVYLSSEDVARLLSSCKLNIDSFIDRYCRWIPYYDGSEVLCLKEKKNFDCIFWDGGCSVYKSRPVQCATYPFWTYILQNMENWIQESKECPGINNGGFHPYEEIMRNAEKYERNIPLKRDELGTVFSKKDMLP